MGLPPIPWELQPGIWAHGGAPREKVPNVLAVPCALSESRAGDSGLPLSLFCPHLTFTSALAGEHEWKIVSTGITDCYFNVTELPPGSTAKFRVACVNKAGQGPYSNPSVKVHLEAAGEQALSHGREVAMGPPVASGVLWGSLSAMASSPQGFGK